MLGPAPMRARLPALRPSPGWSLGLAAALRRSLLPRPPPRLLSPSPSRSLVAFAAPLSLYYPHSIPTPHPAHIPATTRRWAAGLVVASHSLGP